MKEQAESGLTREEIALELALKTLDGLDFREIFPAKVDPDKLAAFVGQLFAGIYQKVVSTVPSRKSL